MGMTIEHAKKLLSVIVASISDDDDYLTIENENLQVFKSALLVLLSEMEELEQEPILGKINKMKSEIADSLEFWDYSPNNNPLARDMLETLTNFLGDIRAEMGGRRWK